MVPINYWAVVVCALVSVGLGFAWYGPLFGKSWLALAGITPDKIAAAKAKNMQPLYGLALVGSLVMSYVLAHALVFSSAYMSVSGVSAGLQVGFWNWLGFIAPVTLSSVLWEGKPWKLWLLNNGYYLVSLLLMGVILAQWQ